MLQLLGFIVCADFSPAPDGRCADFWCCDCTAAAVDVAWAKKSANLFGWGAAVDIGVVSCICDVCDNTVTEGGIFCPCGIVLCILSARCGAIGCLDGSFLF